MIAPAPRRLMVALIAISLLSACGGFQIDGQVPVDPRVDDIADVLVLNGVIEKGQPAWIELSHSEDIDALASVPIKVETNATVTLSVDDGATETLTHVEDGRYEGKSILGEVGRTYTMTVELGGETYSASVKMLPETKYLFATVKSTGGAVGKGGQTTGYSDEYAFADDPATRDRYIFQWWTNGVHRVQQDWAIDDNRVVNSGGKLKLFTVTLDPGPNEHTRHRVARVDKATYDYFNMYERIVRKLIGVASVTPYNPVSNFGGRTVGNFRAVAFAEAILLTPPNPCTASVKASAQTTLQNQLKLAPNSYFTKYHLYWSTSAGVTDKSTKLADVKPVVDKDGKTLVASHVQGLQSGRTYYYRVQVEDAQGHVSVLSPEVSVVAGSGEGTCSASTPTTPCPSDLKAKCDPSKDTSCVAANGAVYACSSKGAWEPKTTPGSMTCGGETKQCDEVHRSSKGNFCRIGSGWWQCKDDKWASPGGK